jgi:hypothetical protein
MQKIRWGLGVVSIVGLAMTSLGCGSDGDGDKLDTPTELLGTWEQSLSSGCIRTYVFETSEFRWTESCPGYAADTYSDTLAEVWPNERIFRTPDSAYYWWHIEGSNLYMDSTNPGGTRPVPADNWWANYVPYVRQ